MALGLDCCNSQLDDFLSVLPKESLFSLVTKYLQIERHQYELYELAVILNECAATQGTCSVSECHIAIHEARAKKEKMQILVNLDNELGRLYSRRIRHRLFIDTNDTTYDAIIAQMSPKCVYEMFCEDICYLGVSDTLYEAAIKISELPVPEHYVDLSDRISGDDDEANLIRSVLKSHQYEPMLRSNIVQTRMIG